jgi:hypothetical protein
MDLRNGDWVMEAASSLILTNQPYQTGPINQELSGQAPFFKCNILSNYKNMPIFICLYDSHFLTGELKGRPLIIIMRPTASLTDC